MAIYLFKTGTSWTVPTGVSNIQVECYGSGSGFYYSSQSPITTLISGGSYSKSTSIAVTPGSTVYFNIGSSGGNTWFNITNTAPTSSSSTSSACLAVGSSTASASQIAANCGDTKYKGGAGYNSNGGNAGYNATGEGGQAGPNGNGADAGNSYQSNATNTPKYGVGGGANGGSQGGYQTIPYGRGGASSSQGWGGYYNGQGNLSTTSPTQDIVGTSNFVNGSSSAQTYGPWGGGGGYTYNQCIGCTCITFYSVQTGSQTGFVVITATAAPVVALTGSSSTASAGTLTNSQTLTQALTGRFATASAGTLTPVPSFTQTLSGVSASASAGVLNPSNDQTVNLNSASIAAYSGTLTNSQALEIALTGVSVNGQTSSFPANSDLIGAEAAGTTGSFDYRNTGWQPIDTAGTSNWTDIDTQI